MVPLESLMELHQLVNVCNGKNYKVEKILSTFVFLLQLLCVLSYQRLRME